MVMEAPPSPQSVGREFVRQYYTLLNKAPAHLHRFYNNYSSFVHGGLDAPNRESLPVVGQKQIHNRIQQLNFRDCHAKISQVDSQATLGSGVVVQVTGELSNGGAPMRRFTQTFVLAAQSPKKYYVHNDIFRYQDLVCDDEEADASGAEEPEREPAGYFPAAPPAFPPPPQLSPPPPAAPPAPAPAPPHLNGHQAAMDEPVRHLAAALQASGLSHVAAEREAEPEAAPACVPQGGAPAPCEPAPEPEPEREPTPPPMMPAAPPAAPEPKTYANLLKSGSGGAGVAYAASLGGGGMSASGAGGAGAASSRVSPPHAPPPDARPRPPRAPREAHPPPAEGPGGVSGGGMGGGGPAGGPGGAPGGGRRYSDSQQLFLGNLPHSATEEELRALFARFGPVAELRVHSKPVAPGAPRHPNYGFITYESAQAACDCLNAAPLYLPVEGCEGGVKLNVEEKKARARDAPRRRPLSSHRPPFRQPYRR